MDNLLWIISQTLLIIISQNEKVSDIISDED